MSPRFTRPVRADSVRAASLSALLAAAAGCSFDSGSSNARRPETDGKAAATARRAEAATTSGAADDAIASASNIPAWAWGENTNAAGSSGEGLSQVSFAHEGADADPCLTPDGEWLVYSSTQHSDTADIYIKRVNSRVVSRLTTDPARDTMPKVSPGGDRIAFASDRAGNWDIYVMPLGGGAAVQVTTESTQELHPSWSPDGRYLAFCRMSGSGRWEVWRCPAGGEAPGQFLTYGMFPEWCPTPTAEGSERILFQRGRERGDRSFGIWTIDYRDGLVESLTEIVSIPRLACINPSWSADGEWIAFSSVLSGASADRPTRADLWLIRGDGEGLVSVASGRGVHLMPAWGPDETVYFVSDRGGTENVWSIPVASAVATASTNAGEGGTAATESGEETPKEDVGNEALAGVEDNG